MSEFCSQSHAPSRPYGKKPVRAKHFRRLVILTETEMASFLGPARDAPATFTNQQGPRQAKDYGT
jgi:hypothetical protein